MTPEQAAQRLRERIRDVRLDKVAGPFWEAFDAYAAFVRVCAVAETLRPLREMGLINQARLDQAEAERDAMIRALEAEGD